jgi:hypothetical protein
MRKADVLRVVNAFPDEVEFDVLLDKLLLLRKIEVAEREIAEGKGIPQAEAERIVLWWLAGCGTD